LIFAQIFSDHFSSAASFASIYSSSALIRDDRLVGDNTILPFIQPDNTVIFEENSKAIELEETFFKGKHLNINQL
jgi:hypothetical protein